MSKDLLKRAEEHLKNNSGVMKIGNIEVIGNSAANSIIQELLDKLKGDAERLESKELVEEVAAAIRVTPVDDTFDAPHEYIIASKILALAVLNVIKGDDDDS